MMVGAKELHKPGFEQHMFVGVASQVKAKALKGGQSPKGVNGGLLEFFPHFSNFTIDGDSSSPLWSIREWFLDPDFLWPFQCFPGG